jgi:hypothetical protein
MEKKMNKTLKTAAVLGLAGAMLALVAASAHSNGNGKDGGRNDSYGEHLVRLGYELVPPGVKLNLQGKNRALVGLGSYVVNTSGCIDCHSHPSYSPGGDPFLGQHEVINAPEYLSGGRQFGPTLTAPNITPDYAGRPAGLTRQQFIQTLRTGHNPKDPPGEILQVMPWPTFGKKSDVDLAAIYEYLRAIPSLPDNTHPGP